MYFFLHNSVLFTLDIVGPYMLLSSVKMYSLSVNLTFFFCERMCMASHSHSEFTKLILKNKPLATQWLGQPLGYGERCKDTATPVQQLVRGKKKILGFCTLPEYIQNHRSFFNSKISLLFIQYLSVSCSFSLSISPFDARFESPPLLFKFTHFHFCHMAVVSKSGDPCRIGDQL